MAVGLYAGSFDPIHRGHVDLIEAAVRCLDRLFVVVAGNPDKANSLLSFDERRQLIIAGARKPRATQQRENTGCCACSANQQ